MKWSCCGMVTLALLLGCLGPARADLSNGDFQTGDLTGWTVFTPLNGTNGSGLPNVVSFDTTGTGTSLAAHFNVGEITLSGLEERGGLFQDVTLSPGAYTVTADIASQNDQSGLVNSDAGTFSVLVDGVVLNTVSLGAFSNPAEILRGHLQASTTISTAGSHKFRFKITRHFLSGGVNTPDEYLDNATLVANGPTPIPEPSTSLLLAISLAGLLAFGWRRRQRAA